MVLYHITVNKMFCVRRKNKTFPSLALRSPYECIMNGDYKSSSLTCSFSFVPSVTLFLFRNVKGRVKRFENARDRHYNRD